MSHAFVCESMFARARSLLHTVVHDGVRFGNPKPRRSNAGVRVLLSIPAAALGGTVALTCQTGDVTQAAAAMLRLTADLVAVMRILCIYAFPGGGPRGSDSNPVSEKKAAHAAAATVLRDLLMSNGGVYIKIGQHIGTMAHLLPEEYVRAMAGLFEHTTPTPWADVKQCLEHEFGPVDSVFRWISQTPIASASLAQVHEAIDLNGKKVAVKVLHKSVLKSADVDIQTAFFLVKALHFMFPTLDFLWLAEEIQRNLPLEMNFVHEAANRDQACALNTKSNVKFPEVYRVSQHAMIMEYAEGVRINDASGIRALGLDTGSVARLLTEVYSDQMFVHGFIHCDPHPGNILVGLDKNQQLQLTLLDHGLYMKIDDQFRMNYCRLWRSLILGDVEGIKLYAASMNAGHAYHLFAGMLTYKTWDTVTDPTRTTDLDRLKIVARKDPDQFDHVQADPVLQEYASRYATEIADILNRLPRAMLLMFKTNDCLRSVDIALGNPVSNHLIMAQACLRVIVADRLRGASNVWQKMRIVWEEFPVWLRLAAFDWLSWYASKSTTRVSAHTIPL